MGKCLGSIIPTDAAAAAAVAAAAAAAADVGVGVSVWLLKEVGVSGGLRTVEVAGVVDLEELCGR